MKSPFTRRRLLRGAIAGSILPPAAAIGWATRAGQPAPDPAPAGSPQLREYWIQADAFQHDLVPTGLDAMMGMRFTAQQTSFVALGYRAYSAGWRSPLPGSADLGPNTGIPGPVLRATVGDTIRIHFRNNDSHYRAAHSMHAHGVVYQPIHDGTWTAMDQYKPGTAVAPGESYTYEWRAAASSVGTWPYHDHSKPFTAGTQVTNMELGAELGLLGLLAITDHNTPKADRENCLFMYDLYQADIPSLAQDFDSFNGQCYLGNTPVFHARVGERVRWRIAALGEEFHAFHIHGHRWQSAGQWKDVEVVGPSASVTIDYIEDNPGDWLYHCHVTDHMMGGMMGSYIVSS